MALKGFYPQNTNYNAEDLRQILHAVFPDAYGVIDGLSFNAPTNGGTISVSAGRAILTTNSGTITGGARYVVQNTAAYNAKNDSGGSTSWAIATAGNSRVDTVYIRQTDSSLEGGSDAVDIYFKTGALTAGTGALPPTISSALNFCVLGHIYSYNAVGGNTVVRTVQTAAYPVRRTVAAMGGTSVSTTGAMPTGGMTEGRQWFSTDDDREWYHDGAAWKAKNFNRVVTSTTRPSAPYTGERVVETDTGLVERQWSGSAWVPVAPEAWHIYNAGATGPLSPLAVLTGTVGNFRTRVPCTVLATLSCLAIENIMNSPQTANLYLTCSSGTATSSLGTCRWGVGGASPDYGGQELTAHGKIVLPTPGLHTFQFRVEVGGGSPTVNFTGFGANIWTITEGAYT